MAGKRAAGRGRRKELPATTQGAEDFILCVASAGVRLQNNEPIGQFLRQIAKTERIVSEVAAHLAEKERQGQGIG